MQKLFKVGQISKNLFLHFEKAAIFFNKNVQIVKLYESVERERDFVYMSTKKVCLFISFHAKVVQSSKYGC